MTIRYFIKKNKFVVKSHTKRFCKKTLGKIKPNNTCFSVCYPLSLYLENYDVKNSISGGYYFINESKFCAHYWLKLDGFDNRIIDPTIRQFEKNLPSIYFGPKTSKYKESTFNFEETYEAWRKGLFDPNYQFREGLKRETVLKLHRRASILLRRQCKRK